MSLGFFQNHISVGGGREGGGSTMLLRVLGHAGISGNKCEDMPANQVSAAKLISPEQLCGISKRLMIQILRTIISDPRMSKFSLDAL